MLPTEAINTNSSTTCVRGIFNVADPIKARVGHASYIRYSGTRSMSPHVPVLASSGSAFLQAMRRWSSPADPKNAAAAVLQQMHSSNNLFEEWSIRQQWQEEVVPATRPQPWIWHAKTRQVGEVRTSKEKPCARGLSLAYQMASGKWRLNSKIPCEASDAEADPA